MPQNANGAGSIRKKTVKGRNGRDYIFYLLAEKEGIRIGDPEC